MTGKVPCTLGIIGGGQLGRMLIYRTRKLGFRFVVLDADPSAPARSLADDFIQGDLYDPKSLSRLLDASDIATYEIEHINIEPLLKAEQEGKKILPSPRLLRVIQDKLLQKDTFAKHNIPIPRFFSCDTPVDSRTLYQRAQELGFSFPLVQKSRKGGYDGRGVKILQSSEDPPMPVPSLLEEVVPFTKELAVMAARGMDGSFALYPVTEMTFYPDHNICDTVFAPAEIPEEVKEQAQRVARSAVEALEGVGVFGVELFLTPDNQVLVNEVAPRPHNSGHYTMEACITCQFEQHLRAITGLPLGAIDLLRPAVMVNLLGEPGYRGKPYIEGLTEALSIPGVSLHLYGKKEVRPFRKMGHCTVLGATLEEARRKAERIRGILKIKSA